MPVYTHACTHMHAHTHTHAHTHAQTHTVHHTETHVPHIPHTHTYLTHTLKREETEVIGESGGKERVGEGEGGADGQTLT